MPAPEFLEGKYDVISKIREGGMGAIYQVRHRLLREMRVVKVMHPQVASSAEQRKRFLREAQTATRLRHANIVTFYDFAIDPDGTAYMVMEYVDGTDLSDLVRRVGPIPVELALVLLRQCLSAMGYLHKRSIVHRDVSPDNILLCRDEEGAPQAKLIDLGIAKVARDTEGLTAADEFLGKLRYASPEQLTGGSDGPIDGRSDLYSLGAVAYEILTGVCPFRGKSLQSILAAHLTGAPVSFDESDPGRRVSDPLRRVLMRVLQIRPEDRFDTAEEFLGALESISISPDPIGTEAFLDRVLGPRRTDRETDATAVHLPRPRFLSPSAAEAETEIRAPGAVSESPPRPRESETVAEQPPPEQPPSPVSAKPIRPLPSEPERTQLYRGRPSPRSRLTLARRVPVLLYGGIAAAAVVTLAVLWLRPGTPARSSSKVERLPSYPSGLLKPAVTATAAPSPVTAPAVATVIPTQALVEGFTPVEVPTATMRTADRAAPETTPIVVAQFQSTPRGLRERRTPRPQQGSAALPAVSGSAIEEPRTLYCARISGTAYTQAKSEEKPHGFASDSAQVLRGPRTDAGRIHIEVAVQPNELREGEPFMITAKLFNDGSMDLIVRKVEESAPAAPNGYRAVEGIDAGAIGIGGYRSIYAYRGTLSGGGTYRKELVVTDSVGDSWRTSIQIVPCR